MTTVPVLYQDEFLVAVHKPPGMLIHRTRLATEVRECLLQTVRDQLGRHLYPIHRLDRPTSGVVLFGLSSEVARDVSAQFVERTVDKRYLAIVRGHIQESGVIDSPMKEKLDRIADAKARQDKEPQSAETHWKRLHYATLEVPVGRYPTARYSVVEVHPRTGRKHQIRRHLRRLPHPILGDREYGDRDHNQYFREQLGIGELLLSAVSLAFDHPATGEPTVIHGPLTEGFERAFEVLGVPSSDSILPWIDQATTESMEDEGRS